MKLKFIEATQSVENGPNWGKFMVGQWTDEEWAEKSEVDGLPLVRARGWAPNVHILVMDLQTGEGGIFGPRTGSAHHDLEKHKLWVCPMFEPFLTWLYTQDITKLDSLPKIVQLPNAPFEFRGYRRPGLSVPGCVMPRCHGKCAETGLLVERNLCALHLAEALAWFNSAEGVGFHPNEGPDILHWVTRVAKKDIEK